MKFGRRSTTQAPPDGGVDSLTGDVAPAPPRPPDGHPAATYAAVLDGDLLWVAIEARPGVLALRDPASGEVLSLPDHSADDQPAYTCAWLDLTALPPAAPATYDVVLARPGSRRPVTVWSPPLAPAALREGRVAGVRHALRRTPDGMLQLERSEIAPAATLRTIAAEPDAVRLSLADAGPTLAALDDSDTVLASWPVIDQQVLLTVDALPDVEPQQVRLVTGEPGAWLPVRRRANGLPDPRKAAQLAPVFVGDEPDPRVRLRWSERGELTLRILRSTGTSGVES